MPIKNQPHRSVSSGITFFVQKGELERHQLPPCNWLLINKWTKLAQRANYQAGIWRRCLEKDRQVPSPIGRGWNMEREQEAEHLVVDWVKASQHLKLSWICWPKKCSPPRCVLLTACGALTCVDLQTVRARHQSQTVKKVRWRSRRDGLRKLRLCKAV